jgi:hypothetical protein
MISPSLTDADIARSTIVFAALTGLAIVLVGMLAPLGAYPSALPAFLLASGSFWFVLTVLAFAGFWEMYYAYFYPGWVRYLSPLNFFLYGALGYLVFTAASALPFRFLLGCAVVGGMEGVAEHVIGIRLGILEKVPIFEDLHVRPVLVFSFFEYALYWTLVAGLATGLAGLIQGR